MSNVVYSGTAAANTSPERRRRSIESTNDEDRPSKAKRKLFVNSAIRGATAVKRAPPPPPQQQQPIRGQKAGTASTWANEWRLAKEKWYTWILLLPAVILMHNTAHNAVFWRWNKEQMYDEHPLPDLFLNYEQTTDSKDQHMADAARFVLFVFICGLATVAAFSRRSRGESPVLVAHRFIIVYSVSSVLRCLTFFLTLLPATASYCLASELGGTYTPERAPRDVVDIFTRFDWTHACGDLLFSGHTVLVVCSHMVNENLLAVRGNSARDLRLGWSCNPLLQLSRVALPLFMFFTVRARKHYSIDVVIALIVTVLLWLLIDPVRIEREQREKRLRRIKIDKDEGGVNAPITPVVGEPGELLYTSSSSSSSDDDDDDDAHGVPGLVEASKAGVTYAQTLA